MSRDKLEASDSPLSRSGSLFESPDGDTLHTITPHTVEIGEDFVTVYYRGEEEHQHLRTDLNNLLLRKGFETRRVTRHNDYNPLEHFHESAETRSGITHIHFLYRDNSKRPFSEFVHEIVCYAQSLFGSENTHILNQDNEPDTQPTIPYSFGSQGF